MSLSDSDSPLSSPPTTDDEHEPIFDRHVDVKPKRQTKRKKNVPTVTKIKLKAPVRSPSPAPKRRKIEPPHVYTLADSQELALIVMFRSRFSDAFKGIPNLGCQDIERGIVDSTPSEQVENLLCGIIGLVLNRKKPVERGHYNRALEEAISTHKAQWPRDWEWKNPLPGGRCFKDLDAQQRLIMLKALINWALTSSEVIRGLVQENYKGSRREDDLNVAISVQPWGRDGDKRRYWLIEGQDDTPFRLYRESSPGLENTQWISVAGTIEELKHVAHELEEDDGTKHALALKNKIDIAITRFEEGEAKRKKREYRATRKAMFTQNTGVSLYEGRTRGRRIRYNYSDDEGGKEISENDDGNKRSTRSKASSPALAAPEAPLFTASGRQIRKPNVGTYGEIKINGSAGASGGLLGEIDGNNANGIPEPVHNYNLEDDDVEAPESGGEEEAPEWDGDSEGDDDKSESIDWDEAEKSFTGGDEPQSLRIILKVNGKRLNSGEHAPNGVTNGTSHSGEMAVGSDPPNASANDPTPDSVEVTMEDANIQGTPVAV